jgi:DNA-binding NarL/FixJ family response regulator
MSSPSLTGVISVLVADSNQTQSQLLCGAPRRQGTFRVANVPAQLSECLSVLENDPPDVVLLADRTGNHRHQLYELVRGIHAASPNLPMVILLDNYDCELVVNSLRAGARGLFCLASMPFKYPCRCITSVHQGQYWTNMEQMRYLIDALSTGSSARLINSLGQVVLTPREEQTVNPLSEGLTNREIARELNLKENTVKKSLLRICDKLGVSNRVELVLYALNHWQARASDSSEKEQPSQERVPEPAGGERLNSSRPRASALTGLPEHLRAPAVLPPTHCDDA